MNQASSVVKACVQPDFSHVLRQRRLDLGRLLDPARSWLADPEHHSTPNPGYMSPCAQSKDATLSWSGERLTQGLLLPISPTLSEDWQLKTIKVCSCMRHDTAGFLGLFQPSFPPSFLLCLKSPMALLPEWEAVSCPHAEHLNLFAVRAAS